MDNKHNIDLNSGADDDYYAHGVLHKSGYDHVIGNSSGGSGGRNSPLVDFDDDSKYYSHEKPKNPSYTPSHRTDDIIGGGDSYKRPDRPEHLPNHTIHKYNDFTTTHKTSPSHDGDLINVDHLKERFKDLIYWRDARISGSILALFLVLLFTLSHYSIISIIGYLGLTVLGACVAYYVYQNLMQTLNKTKQGHVFKDYLDQHINISPETGRRVSDKVVKHLNTGLRKARNVFLVEDVMSTIKFGFVLWAMTYIGAYFNGLTLFVLLFVGLFTIPKIYQTYQSQINKAFYQARDIVDHNKDIAMKNIKDKAQMVKDKVSHMKKQ